MTIALEHIQDGDWAAVNRVVDTLRSLVPDTGGVSLGIRTGSASAVFAAANIADVTIAHGLGRVPVWADGKTTNSQIVEYELLSATTASMVLRAYTTTQAVATATITFKWVAIG